MSTDQEINSIVRIENAINQTLALEDFAAADITVHIKRLDLIHPEVNGNKWFKLKYNLKKAQESEHKTLLTFGGAWSNHIHATASAGFITGIKTIGIIRGEESNTPSSTIIHAKKNGMQLEYITRLAYAEKETEDFIGWLHEEHGSFHLVPEGGSNYLGINGCMEILSAEDKQQYDYICCACGTGSTLAGLLMSAPSSQNFIGFPALKDGAFLKEEIIKQLRYFLMSDELAREFETQFELITDYHFGGYAKWNDELIQFIKKFESTTGIPLDQVYTGKMMYGLADLIKKNHFTKGTRILVIHSGGLQGKAGALLV